jgi:hypothetical protein
MEIGTILLCVFSHNSTLWYVKRCEESYVYVSYPSFIMLLEDTTSWFVPSLGTEMSMRYMSGKHTLGVLWPRDIALTLSPTYSQLVLKTEPFELNDIPHLCELHEFRQFEVSFLETDDFGSCLFESQFLITKSSVNDFPCLLTNDVSRNRLSRKLRNRLSRKLLPKLTYLWVSTDWRRRRRPQARSSANQAQSAAAPAAPALQVPPSADSPQHAPISVLHRGQSVGCIYNYWVDILNRFWLVFNRLFCIQSTSLRRNQTHNS